ncbi:MAG: hypothetical protein U5K00_23995 [Melioribacteraceae bacterium]|nr:hypothetical protein [Melioribacteraceae bacterium]
MKKFLTFMFIIALFFGCTKEVPERPTRGMNLKGEYLGETPPDTTAKVFGLKFVSTGMNERDAAFSPDGEEFYFSIWQNDRGSIVVTKMVNERWTTPKVVSFSGVYDDIEPFIALDGSRLFFASNRPVEGTTSKDFDIWYVEKNDDGSWGEPQNLGEPVNSEVNEFYPTLTETGDLYFTANLEDSFGREDIYVSKFVDGEYQKPENLGDKVNSENDEFNSFISKDGSYLIYTTTGFGNGFGGGDLWVNFKAEDGTWSGPKNLGDGVNTNKLEYCPSITPDGKYLFFTSNRVNDRIYDQKMSYERLVEEFNNPYNGSGDIYWVSVEVIERLR